MAEYGREQRNQLSRAIANSDAGSRQLKGFVDNRIKAGIQFSLSTSVIQKRPIYRRFDASNEARYPRVRYSNAGLPHMAESRFDITATIPGVIPLNTITVPQAGQGVSVNTNRAVVNHLPGTRTMQVDDSAINGNLNFDHRGNGHRLIMSANGNYQDYLTELGQVAWAPAP